MKKVILVSCVLSLFLVQQSMAQPLVDGAKKNRKLVAADSAAVQPKAPIQEVKPEAKYKVIQQRLLGTAETGYSTQVLCKKNKDDKNEKPHFAEVADPLMDISMQKAEEACALSKEEATAEQIALVKNVNTKKSTVAPINVIGLENGMSTVKLLCQNPSGGPFFYGEATALELDNAMASAEFSCNKSVSIADEAQIRAVREAEPKTLVARFFNLFSGKKKNGDELRTKELIEYNLAMIADEKRNKNLEDALVQAPVKGEKTRAASGAAANDGR